VKGIAKGTDEIGLEKVEWRPIERAADDAAVALEGERDGHAQ
jgi:hypothetical protein